MFQMYFLSIILNVLAGLILLSKKPVEDTTEAPEKKRNLIEDMNKSLSENNFFQNKSFALVIAILALLTGIIKLFCVAKGGIIILGDLLPALAGITAGFAILLNYYLSTATVATKLPAIIKTIFVDNISWVGIIACAIALLHFIMPGVIFF